MFLYSYWITIPFATRIKIAEIFGIQKKGPTEVFNNMVKSDGYVVREVEMALTKDRLQEYLKTDEQDLNNLLMKLVDKVEGNDPVLPMPTLPIQNKRGRTRKNG